MKHIEIHTQISGIIFILISFTALITITSSYFISKQMIMSEIDHRLDSLLTSRAAHIEMLVNDGVRRVKTFAHEHVFIDAITTHNITPALQKIRTLIDIHDDISRLRVLDKQGQVVVSSHTQIDYQGNAEIFIRGQKEVYIRDIHISSMTDTKVVSISVPIFVQNAFMGIMIVNIEVGKELYQILSQRQEKTDEFYLINKNGYMISPSRFKTETFLKLKIDSSEARTCLSYYETEHNFKHNTSNIYTDYRGKRVIGKHQFIKSRQWCLLAKIDAEEAFTSVYQLVQLITLFFIILLGVSSILGMFLQKMTYSLRQISTENQQQNWLKTGQTLLNNTMRGDLEQDTLATKVITAIAKYTTAQVGLLYLYDDKNEILKLQAHYAFQSHHQSNHMFKLGEGLVGQAALEQEIILVTNNVPTDHLYIHSGLASVAPYNIIIAPFMYNNVLKGVIELGALQAFSVQTQRFLSLITENIAISFISAQSRTEMTQLLAQSQIQKEELSVQQEELRATNEDLELSSRYKSEFLANMSHELRSPLNSMLILSQQLVDNEEGNLTVDQIESAQIVYNGGQDLLKLINGILDLSKIEAGKMSLVIHTVHLRDFAHTLQSNFKPIAHKKALAFHIKFAQDLPVNIETDDQRLAQVITNLLSNAFKFTKTGGITLEFQRRDTKLVISVNDTGIGIPKDKQAIIFEAFQQVDGSISRQYGGTGLGLSISKELAQLLGGTLHCHSVEHEGATFTLIFPLKIPKNQEPLNTPEKKAIVPLEDKINIVFKDKKILIVDDDMRTLFLLSGVFQKHGLQVYKVANGQKALEVLENEHAIDVVIMDIMMPVLDGYKTLQAIRSQERFKNLPVILVTAKASKEEQAKGLAAGANEYLIKPVNVQTLLSLLQLYLYP